MNFCTSSFVSILVPFSRGLAVLAKISLVILWLASVLFLATQCAYNRQYMTWKIIDGWNIHSSYVHRSTGLHSKLAEYCAVNSVCPNHRIWPKRWLNGGWLNRLRQNTIMSWFCTNTPSVVPGRKSGLHLLSVKYFCQRYQSWAICIRAHQSFRGFNFQIQSRNLSFPPKWPPLAVFGSLAMWLNKDKWTQKLVSHFGPKSSLGLKNWDCKCLRCPNRHCHKTQNLNGLRADTISHLCTPIHSYFNRTNVMVLEQEISWLLHPSLSMEGQDCNLFRLWGTITH